MGRVKLQIKRIENTTNRQVTFSKRRNGIVKKAYELSVLCDVDVALIMFSPSGRLSLFSGNKSIEEVLARYVNLPEHERGRLRNQEFLQRALSKLRNDQGNQIHQTPSPSSSDSQNEANICSETQQEILSYKSQLENIKQRLNIFEEDPSEIKTLSEADCREHILVDILRKVQERKQLLLMEQNYSSCGGEGSPSELVCTRSHLHPDTANVNGYVIECPTPSNVPKPGGWLAERDPQVQILNFLDANGLLAFRNYPQREDGICSSTAASTIIHGQNMNIGDPLVSSSINNLEADTANKQLTDQFGQALDINMSLWSEFNPIGRVHFPAPPQPREQAAANEPHMSQFSPPTIWTSNHHQQPI